MTTAAPLFPRKLIAAAIGVAFIGTAAGLSLSSQAAKPQTAMAAPMPVTSVIERR